MDDSGIISGNQQISLFEALRDKGVLINLRVRRGADLTYERLTVITEVKKSKDGFEIGIDPPKGFQAAVGAQDPWQIHFAFTGLDRLEYRFTTVGGRMEANIIWLPAPETVERIQRRRHFRMPTPPGVRLNVTLGNAPRVLEVVNISLGGLLGVLGRLKKEINTDPVMTVGQLFYDLNVLCPGSEDGPEAAIHIKKAIVRRVEIDSEAYRHRYALEFLTIANRDVRALTQFIYRLQREFLRRR